MNPFALTHMANTVSPSFLSLLKHCKTLRPITQIHTHIIKSGLHSDPLLIIGNLIVQYTLITPNPSTLHLANSILTHFPNPTPFMYNTLIRAFSESDHPHGSFATFLTMHQNNVQPDSFSFSFVFKTVASIQCINIGVQLHCLGVVYGLDNHLYVTTTLVMMYSECGLVQYARKVFDEMSKPNVGAWNAMINGCRDRSQFDSFTNGYCSFRDYW